ncbi:MAG: retroviral-like aspartic protease family protein [Steroidobacteraceae bacterium]
MQRGCVVMLMGSLGLRVCGASAADAALAEVPVDTPVLEEIFVEAPEPRYVAPTLRDRIGRVWAPVMINGKGPFRLVLDTGATTSAIVSSVADRLGIPTSTSNTTKLHGATGALMVPYVVADRIEIGDLLVENAKLPIVPDVFGGAEGVLGTQGLGDKRIYIDFRKDLIEIAFSRGKPHPQGFSSLSFDMARGRLVMLKLRVGGVRTQAIIDTGAQHTIGNSSLREALLLRHRAVQDADIIGVTLDVAQGESIATPPIALGDVEIRNLRITFGDMFIFDHWQLNREPALLIGMDIIASLETFVIDYKRREVHLRARR